MRRAPGLVSMLLAALVLLYASRFWPLRLWGWPGLFGWPQLPPTGNLVARWLGGTPFAPFALLVWAAGSFLFLSALQWLVDRLARPGR